MLAWPRLGCVNLHASLLPRWRGAAPIQHAILARDATTGVSVMRMERGLDTGAVYRDALDADRRARNGRRAARPARSARGGDTRRRAAGLLAGELRAGASARRRSRRTRRRSRRRRPCSTGGAARGARRAACARSIRGPSRRRASTTAETPRLARRVARRGGGGARPARSSPRARTASTSRPAPASCGSSEVQPPSGRVMDACGVSRRAFARRRRVRPVTRRAGRGRVRAAAAAVVARVLRERIEADDALAAARAGVAQRDRSLLAALVFGALRWHHRLEWQAARLAHEAVEARPARARRAARGIGLLQLQEMRIPEHAAVSATVDAAALLGSATRRRLVNAVLRRFQRERAALDARARGRRRSAFQSSGWLIDAAAQRLARRLAADSATRTTRAAPMWLRVNVRRTTRATYLDTAACRGHRRRGGRADVATAVVLDAPQPVDACRASRQARSSVQDVAAQRAARLARPRAGAARARCVRGAGRQDRSHSRILPGPRPRSGRSTVTRAALARVARQPRPASSSRRGSSRAMRRARRSGGTAGRSTGFCSMRRAARSE